MLKREINFDHKNSYYDFKLDYYHNIMQCT